MTLPELDEHAPDLAGLDAPTLRRIRQTVACRDADRLPRVPGAGEIFEHDGVSVQRMFNGILVEEGCYFGSLITPIITRLRGVHEPQEEVVVHAILERLRAEQAAGELLAPVAVEPGAFWAYYSMWFCAALDGARAVAMEPDPAYLDVGRRNAALNGLADRITFVHGGVGSAPAETFSFRAESDGVERETVQYDLRALMELGGVDHVDVLFCDIQGFETPLLQRAADLLSSGAVRFLVVSTHHRSISGHALTHQDALALLEGMGAHVIAEHTVAESASGDGLIAVSFDPRDRDLVVEISHVRARHSLFGELEYELHHEVTRLDQVAEQLSAEQAEVARLTAELAEATAANARLRARLQKLRRRLRRVQDRPAAPPRGGVRRLVGRLARRTAAAAQRAR